MTLWNPKNGMKFIKPESVIRLLRANEKKVWIFAFCGLFF